MPHWTRALKPYQDEETGETILFCPCPQLPNNIIFDIINQADGGRTAHRNKFKNCFEEMTQKYYIEVEHWDEEIQDYNETEIMWVTEAYNTDQDMVNFCSPFNDNCGFIEDTMEFVY
jgi:hypothetical protein